MFSSADELVAIFAGWGGDLTTFAENVMIAAKNGMADYTNYAINSICRGEDTSFSLKDYLADIDAVNFGYLIGENNIADYFYSYFISGNAEICKVRTRMFIRNKYDDLTNFNYVVKVFSDDMDGDFLNLDGKLREQILEYKRLPDKIYRDASVAAFTTFVKNEYDARR